MADKLWTTAWTELADDAMVDADKIDDSASTHKFATAAQLAAVDGLAATYQPLDADLTALAAAGNSATLAATTASFTTADESKLDGIEAGAQVVNTANVTAAGALMDSEVDADIKTLSLPANTTISTFGASLVDDTSASAARATLNAAAADSVPITTQTDSYTLALSDAGSIVEMNKATATVVTVPPQSSVAWAAGTVIGVRQVGAGGVSIAAGAGVTIRNSSASLVDQFTELQLQRRAENDWVIVTGAGIPAQTVNAQTGTTYTLAVSDGGRLVTLSNVSAITLTLPQDSDADIPIGVYVDILQLGAGQVNVAAGTGATLRTSGLTAKARAQYSRLGVQKIAADTWSLFGDLAAS